MTTTALHIVQALIARTREDFSGYYRGDPRESRAQLLVQWAVDADPRLDPARAEIDAMLPDTEQDGRWEASYALNTGCMMLCLIDFRASGEPHHCQEAVRLFFDTVDFKVQQRLEGEGVVQPSELQITSHPVYAQERQWFERLATAAVTRRPAR